MQNLKNEFLNIKVNSELQESDALIEDPKYFLLMFIITASLPFRCVENKFFKLFCNSIYPNFKTPSRKEIAELTSTHYKSKKNEIISKLKKVNVLNFRMDCWTSVQNFSYLSVTAHYLCDKLKLNSIF